MTNKIDIREKHGNMYDYSVSIMGREELLLTTKELLMLYDDLTELILDNEELWRI